MINEELMFSGYSVATKDLNAATEAVGNEPDTFYFIIT